MAQNKGLVDNSNSPYSKLQSVNLQDVKWTNGFWKEQFDVETKNTLPYMWDLYHNDSISHAYKNFEIAAGESKGTFKGPSFHDGDFYKIFEGMAATYAVTKDKKLDAEMDKAIALICQNTTQRRLFAYASFNRRTLGNFGAGRSKKTVGFREIQYGAFDDCCLHSLSCHWKNQFFEYCQRSCRLFCMISIKKHHQN